MRGPTGWFPRSLPIPSTGSAPSYALQHRHDYAAVLHRGLPAGDITRPGSSSHDLVRVRTALRPRSTRFEPLGLLRGVQPLVPHVRLFVLLAGPRPSGSAGPSRRCQGCCPPSPPPRGSGCPQLRWLAAMSQWRCPFTTAGFESASWRSMSATHRSSGRLAEQSRFNRSRAGATSIFPRRHFFLERAPTRCAPRMIRATRLRPMQ